MSTITLYTWDAVGNFAGEQEVDAHGAMPPRSTTRQPASAECHWTGSGWADGLLQVPEPAQAQADSVPSAVTMRQARLALLGAGLLDDIDAAINGLPSPQKEAARIEWEYSQEVQRHNGFVSVLAPMLGLTEAQTDALFVQAATL